MKIPIFCNIYKFLLLNLMKFGRQSPSIVPNDLSDQPSTEHFSLVPSWWNLVCSRFALFRSQLNCVIYEFLIFCDCHCKKKGIFHAHLNGSLTFFWFWEIDVSNFGNRLYLKNWNFYCLVFFSNLGSLPPKWVPWDKNISSSAFDLGTWRWIYFVHYKVVWNSTIRFKQMYMLKIFKNYFIFCFMKK